uniref:Predicted protein n=1 Tax=Hordeum vulgare subsp. vulgare TaxID=112509 RepID=F2CV43_HORVV|nr:predicted protein [Hordeum vulgare subsp. vulgare]BAJ88329.1 predicted protein [Hordeum vulgare subsp. vulgare]
MTLLATIGQPHAPRPTAISHRDHSELRHTLTREPTRQLKFKCNGCLEEGTGGDRYTCKHCDFDLHEACNLQEGTMVVHPLLPESTFQLRHEPPRSVARCSACGTRVQGTHYHCADLYLHPCCALLPMEIELSAHQVRFELREKVSHCCTKCKTGGGVRDYWFYRSTSKDVYLHVGCARESILQPSSSSTESHSHVHGNTPSRVGRNVNGNVGRNLDNICDIIKALAGIVLAVLTCNPLPLIAAGIDLFSNVARLRTR